jgi:hypothetical protein
LTIRQPRDRLDRITLWQEAHVDIPEERYQEIASTIFSEDSPVGIDAKKTHVMILYMLEQIEKRVARIEEQLETSP